MKFNAVVFVDGLPKEIVQHLKYRYSENEILFAINKLHSIKHQFSVSNTPKRSIQPLSFIPNDAFRTILS